MAKKLNLDNIIARNPQINTEQLRRGMEVLEALRQTGVVHPSTYGLETAESKKVIQHSEEYSHPYQSPTKKLG